MISKIITFVTVLLLVSEIRTTWGAKSVSEIMDSLFTDKSTNPTDYYDKRVRPNHDGNPVEVSVSAYILDVYNVDEKKHEFTTTLYLRQTWKDPRLTFQPPTGRPTIMLDPEHAKKMWIPDTFVVNERSSFKHDMTVDNIFTRLSSDGTILRSMRITITASCKMNLKWFPFDRHTASLVFESYGSGTSDFYYTWAKDNNGIPKVGVSAGSGGSIDQQVVAVKADSANIAMSAGNYSRLSIDFIIARVSTRFLQDVYFPATVLTIVAFITMSVGAMQFRVLLSVICMVGIVIFTSLLSTQMPKVSYQTALDFYVFKCSFMVFNVVIVNFIMYHLLKPQARSNTRMRMRQINGSSAEDAKEILPDTEPSEEFHMAGRPIFDSTFKEWTYKLCMYSQFTMPCFFLVFNIIYWMVVLISSSSVGDDTDFMLLENTD